MVLKCNFRRNWEHVRTLPLPLHKIPEYTALADYYNWPILSFIARPLCRVKALKSCEWDCWWMSHIRTMPVPSIQIWFFFLQFCSQRSRNIHHLILAYKPELIFHCCKSSMTLQFVRTLTEPALEKCYFSLTASQWFPNCGLQNSCDPPTTSTDLKQTRLSDTISLRHIYCGPIQEAANLHSFWNWDVKNYGQFSLQSLCVWAKHQKLIPFLQ